jgi:hypothetical protein
MLKPRRIFQLVLLLVSLSLSAYQVRVEAQSYYQVLGDPLGSFEGPGPSAPLNWTGDGQRLGNPSFETGTLASWVQSQSNAATGSNALVVGPGQEGVWSVQLTVQSANVSAESRVSVLQDLSLEQVAFGASIRLRASVYLEQLTGTSTSDRAEVAVTLSTTTGLTRTIHYYHGMSPANSTSDAYLPIGAVTGQWVNIDRNVAADALARFSADFATLNAVREVRVTVLSRTAGNDSRITFYDLNGNFAWDTGESVAYDADRDRKYDTGEPVILGSAPPNQGLVQDDPKTRLVDSNSNGGWDSGESVIYDSDNDNVYESGEPVIAVAPAVGTVFYRTSASRFDQLELYSATGNFEWVRNGGFEASLAGWGAYAVPAAFQAVTTRALSGGYSARGSSTGGMFDMSQGFDARPRVEPWSTFKASSFISDMTGSSSVSYVDVWLGLVDSSAAGNLAFVHYMFMTGDGLIPANSTSAIYHRVNGFGTLGRWLNVTSSLQDEISYFDTGTYTLPFQVLAVVVEVSAAASSLTTAYFDSFSLHGPYHPGPFTTGSASSYRYAVDGVNSTYVYTATSVPHGAFYIAAPAGQSVLNITGPGGVLQLGDYSASSLTGRIDIPDSTGFKHPPVGNWRFVTTSVNAVPTVHVEDPTTRAAKPSVDPGSMVNLVSRSTDPFGIPLPAANMSLTFWTTAGALVGTAWTGTSSNQGWFNVSGVSLQTAGVLKLQATVSASHVGLRTFQVSVLYALTVSMSLSTSQVEAGSPVTISGAVSPSRQGVTITILYRPAGSSDWTILSSVQTDATGGYSYTWKPPEGLYQVMVSATDPQTLSADSSRIQISVSPNNLLDEIVLYAAIVALATVAAAGFLFFRRRRSTKTGNTNPSAS